MWFLIDVIIVLIFALFVISGAKKGFIKAVSGIGVTIIAAILALNLSAPVSEFLKSTVVYEGLTNSLENKIGEYIGEAIDEKKLGTLLGDEPDGIAKFLSGFGIDTKDVSDKYAELIKSGEENVIEKLCDYVVTPAANALSNALAVLSVFIISILALNILVFILDKIFTLPVLNFANKLGGIACGFVIGLIASFVFCVCVNISLPYLPGAGIDIDAKDSDKSILYTAISDINPLSFLYTDNIEK